MSRVFSTLSSFVSIAVASSLLAAAPPAAAEVGIFRMDTREAALEGETDGVAIGPLGDLGLSPEVDRLAGLDIPFVFAASALPDGGVVLGTGNDGQVVRIDADGTPEILGSLGQPTVFAVLGGRDGSILAAGSPDGRVVRFADDAFEDVVDPGATYVWALAEDARGRLLVATGLPGRLTRWDDGESTVLYESPDGHVRTVLPRADGSILVGTAGEGLIVEIAADGTARTLYDAAAPEVLAFAESADGATVWAALLASEASLVDLSNGAEAEDSVAPTIGSRAGTYQGPRSVVVSIDRDGRVERRAELQDETAHALLAQGDDLWVGSGQEGRLYRLRGGAEVDALVRETELEDRQIVALLDGSDAVRVVTTDAAAVYRLSPSRVAAGEFASDVLDAGELARFGTWRWFGDADGGRVEVSARAGMAAEPDATWTDWRSIGRLDGPGELALSALGRGRYVQWKARLVAGSGDQGPRMTAVELSYAQENRAPTITAFEALDPGKILVPQSFNPNSTTFEPWSPNRDGIFTSIRKEREKDQTKELWKRGYRTLRWQAADANGDTMSYALDVRPADGDRADWLPMAAELDQTWFSFDATVLPDGVYRFRVTATEIGRPEDATRSSQRIGEPVIIDHSAPTLGTPERNGDVITVEARDAENPLRHAVVSVDAGPWHVVEASDGLLDSRRETLTIEAPADARMVLLRLTDAALNVVTFDLSR